MADAKPLLGGQALIEGVMMRGPSTLAIAVRRPDGTISVSERRLDLQRRHPILRLPMVRGCMAFVDSLHYGIDSLLHSANEASPEEEQLSRKDMTWAVLLAMVLAVGLFFVAPTLLLGLFRARLHGSAALNIVEGLVRLSFFLVYLLLMSRTPDIRRVFAYHGAEHKTIHCYEAGIELTPANAQRFSVLHPRCGTAFMLIVMVIAIIVYGFFGWPGLLMRLAVRLAFLPLIAGVAYEVMRFLARSDSLFARWLVWPGMLLQRLTTGQPTDEMLEVAIAALRAVLAVGDGLSV